MWAQMKQNQHVCKSVVDTNYWLRVTSYLCCIELHLGFAYDIWHCVKFWSVDWCGMLLMCCSQWCNVLAGHPSHWQNLALAGNDGLAQGRVGKNSVSVMVDHFWAVSVEALDTETVSHTHALLDRYSSLTMLKMLPRCNVLCICFSRLHSARIIQLL